MKKFARALLLLTVFFLYSSGLYANPKNMVCIVRPVLDKEVADSIVRIGDQFDQPELKNYAKGGYGSGFIFIDRNGTNYIITNRHVVAMAQKVELEFLNEDATSTKISDCPVLYVDNDYDLAVIGIAGNKKPFKSGFNISREKMTDGKEVYAAGYPDLLGKPSWQLSKGNISNNKIIVPEIANTDKEWFIQHSASIDPGNSGGPLLKKEANGSFSVVGINTWTVSGRNNVFFSIPSSSVYEVIKRTKLTKDKSDNIRKSDLIANAEEFSNAVNRIETRKNDFRLISYGYAVSNGAADLEYVADQYNEEQMKPLIEKQNKGIFIEFFRHVKLERIKILLRKKMSKKTFEFKKIIGEPVKDETGFIAKTLFQIKKDEYIITWKLEDGHWRIYDADFDQRTDQRSTNYENGKSCTGGVSGCLKLGGIIVLVALIVGMI